MATQAEVIAARAQVKAKDELRHRIFSELFAANDPVIMQGALKVVDLWQARQLCSQIYIDVWTKALHGDQDAIAIILAPDGNGYRQNHPFAMLGTAAFHVAEAE